MKYAINDKHKHLKNSNKNKILVFVAFFFKRVHDTQSRKNGTNHIIIVDLEHFIIF